MEIRFTSTNFTDNFLRFYLGFLVVIIKEIVKSIFKPFMIEKTLSNTLLELYILSIFSGNCWNSLHYSVSEHDRDEDSSVV